MSDQWQDQPPRHANSGQYRPQQPHQEVGPRQQYGGSYGQQQYYGPPPKKKHTVRNVLLILCGLLVLTIGGCVAILGSAIEEEADKSSVAGVSQGGDTKSGSEKKKDSGLPEGVYAFGSTVKFGDGSTLSVGKPVKFNPGEFAIGGEDFKHSVKFKVTFTNNTDETFDPTFTSGNVTSGEREGESIYGEGLDAPENKVLPGKKVTWWMGYGVDKPKDLQFTVSMGFLDYDDVIFVNAKK